MCLAIIAPIQLVAQLVIVSNLHIAYRVESPIESIQSSVRFTKKRKVRPAVLRAGADVELIASCPVSLVSSYSVTVTPEI